jgi:hypothetical protein
MKRGEKIIVERTASGCYAITYSGASPSSETVAVGGAASTMIKLTHMVLFDEAAGDMIEPFPFIAHSELDA